MKDGTAKRIQIIYLKYYCYGTRSNLISYEYAKIIGNILRDEEIVENITRVNSIKEKFSYYFVFRLDKHMLVIVSYIITYCY